MHAHKGTRCRPGNAMTPESITIHNTANRARTAGAINHAFYLNGSGSDKSVSWHYVVDDTKIVECIPPNEHAWHAGDGAYGKGNRTSIAIEICENGNSDQLREATLLACKLTGYLLNKYNLTTVHQHNYWSGKNCPNRIRAGEPFSWVEFLRITELYRKLFDGEEVQEDEVPEPPPQNRLSQFTGVASIGDMSKISKLCSSMSIPLDIKPVE